MGIAKQIVEKVEREINQVKIKLKKAIIQSK